MEVEHDIKSCGRDRMKWEKGCWVGSVLGKRGVPAARKGWAEAVEVEEHSLLQGLHPHFLIMQLLLHLGQLLLQSGELWTQGRAAGYRGAHTQWASLTATCQKRLVMTAQECLALITHAQQKASLWCRRRSRKSVQRARKRADACVYQRGSDAR